MPSLPYWLWPGDSRPTPEIDAEIAEELQLHLDLLAEERERHGATPDDAKRQAAERFGDFDRYLRLCRVEKQGDIPMLKRVQAVSTVLLLVGVVWLAFHEFVSRVNNAQFRVQTSNQLQEIQRHLQSLTVGQKSNSTDGYWTAFTEPRDFNRGPAPESVLDKIELNVVDPSGEPIEGARIALHCFSVGGLVSRELGVTGAKGQLKTEVAFLKKGDLQGVGLVCVAPGYALNASGMTIEHRAPVNSQEIVLRPSTPFRIRLVGPGGEPMRRVSLFPLSRTNLRDQSYTVAREIIDSVASRPANFQRDTGLWTQTDDDGQVVIDWFEARDIAKIALKKRGKKLDDLKVEFEVPSEPNELVRLKEFPNLGFGRVRDQSDTAATETFAKVSGRRADLTGKVTDTNGAPIAEADVLLIVKTWPNNRFRQDDYAVKTDGNGQFTLKGRIPLDGQYVVNAAVVPKGHAIVSKYVLVRDPAGEEPNQIEFQAPRSTTVRMTITDDAGKPLENALVAPSARFPESGDEEHLVYHQGSRPTWKKSNADGLVEIDWFAPGDIGKVRVRPRGGDWQEVDVPSIDPSFEGAPVTIAVTP